MQRMIRGVYIMNLISGHGIWLVSLASMLLAASPSIAQPVQDQDDTAEGESTNEHGPVLEELIVEGKFIGVTGRSALKFDVPLRDVPMTVATYTEDFMKAIETLRVADLYDYMTGVQRAGNTAFDINIRGFASGGADRNAIMVDGLPGLAVRFGSPPTIGAERIEVVKGPASVLYGEIQPGGFVNIVTKKPQAESMHTVQLRSEAFYGDEASISDSLGYTASLDSTGAISSDHRLLYRLIAQYGDNPGFRDFGKGESAYLMPSITWDVSEATSFTGSFEYRKEDVRFDDGLVAPNNADGVPDASLLNQDITTFYSNPDNFQTEEGTSVALSFSRRFTDDLEWRGNFRGVDLEDHRINLDIQGTRTCHPNSVAGQIDPTAICVRRRQRDQLNKRTYYFGDTNLTWEGDFGWMSHKLMFGLNAGRETADFKRNDFGANNDTYDIFLYGPIHGLGTPNPPREDSWAKTTRDSYAFYVQDMISFGEHWKLLLSGRYEDFEIDTESRRPVDHPAWSQPESTSGDSFVPMVGLLFQPGDLWTYYVSYAESFNPPAPGRVDIDGNIFRVPETGRQYEAGVKADVFETSGTVTFSVFQIEKKNALQQIGTTGAFELTGVEESKGFELEGNFFFIDRWQVLAGYSYVDATVKDDVNLALIGQRLRNTAKHSASIWNKVQLSEAFSLGLGINHVGERFGTVPTAAGEAFRLRLPGYTLVDAAAYYHSRELGIDVTLRAGNLLDKKYYPSAFTPTRVAPGAPANVVLSVSKAF
jgi:iron complex outermembrane recepter protein